MWSTPQNDPQVWTTLGSDWPRTSYAAKPCVCCGRDRSPRAAYCTSCRRELERAGVRATRSPDPLEGR